MRKPWSWYALRVRMERMASGKDKFMEVHISESEYEELEGIARDCVEAGTLHYIHDALIAVYLKGKMR